MFFEERILNPYFVEGISIKIVLEIEEYTCSSNHTTPSEEILVLLQSSTVLLWLRGRSHGASNLGSQVESLSIIDVICEVHSCS